MKKRACMFLAATLLLAFLLTACGTIPATATTTQKQPAQTTASTTGSTTTAANPTTRQTTSSTASSSKLSFKKLDELSSYQLKMISEAMDGPATGTANQFNARHLPQTKAYNAIRYMAQNGKDFALAEEVIVIGDKSWNKQAGKSWIIGNSSTAVGYITELTLIYIGLSSGKTEKIDEPTVVGIPTIHYSFLYEKSGNMRLKGEIWIANQNNLPPVPVKGFGEQTALDDQGRAIADYRHVKFEFEVGEINKELTIKPPM